MARRLEQRLRTSTRPPRPEKLLFHVTGAFAEFEGQMVRQARQRRPGAAREQGKRFGGNHRPQDGTRHPSSISRRPTVYAEIAAALGVPAPSSPALITGPFFMPLSRHQNIKFRGVLYWSNMQRDRRYVEKSKKRVRTDR